MTELFKTAIAERVIGCAIEVHRELGPGLFESTYEDCLACEFGLQAVSFLRQVKIPLVYRDVKLDCSYRADFLIDGSLIVELKTVERVLPIHRAQMLTYLKLLKLSQGLVLNFNVTRMVDGICSVVNTMAPREKHEGVEA